MGTALVAAMFPAAFLTGCGDVYEAEDSGTARGEDERAVISVLAGQSTCDAGIEDMIEEAVAEKFPNVELEWECVDWGNDFSSQMQGRIASGDIPDVIIGKAQDVKPYAREGILAPLALEGTAAIQQQALDSVMVDGQLYGLPYNAWYQGVIYNKSLFRRLDLKVPQTRAELQEIVKVLEQEGETPFAGHFLETWKVGNMTMQFLIGDVFSAEADWGDRFRRGEAQFDGNPVMEACFMQNQYVLEHSWEDALIIDQHESDRRFVEGGAAMYLTGSWSLQAVSQYESSMEFGIFPYPGEEGGSELIREINMTFMMSSVTAHSELVQDIFQELFDNEKLMQEILGFTQTYSVVDGVEADYQSNILEDAKWYEEEGRVVDAALGNGQLVWDYQNQLAAETLRWLKGERSLSDVLYYADKHRGESGNQE